MSCGIVPRRPPLILVLVKSIDCFRVRVVPRLVAFAVLKIAVGASYSYVKYQIEFLVKWGVFI